MRRKVQFLKMNRVFFMEDHIPIRAERSLLIGRQNSKLSLWDVVFHENNSFYIIKPTNIYIGCPKNAC